MPINLKSTSGGGSVGGSGAGLCGAGADGAGPERPLQPPGGAT